MIGTSFLPSGVTPEVMAAMIWSSVQFPKPVSLSGVRLGPTNTPWPGNANPTSDPPSMREKSGLPRKVPGVWQSLQPAMVTRYLPRATSISAAEAAKLPRHAAAVSAEKQSFRMGSPFTTWAVRRPRLRRLALHHAQEPAGGQFQAPIAPRLALDPGRPDRRRARSEGPGARSGRREARAARRTRVGSAASSGRWPG